MAFIEMASYTIQNDELSVLRKVFLDIREFNGLHNRPSENIIDRIFKNFLETGSMENQKSKKYIRSRRSQERYTSLCK